MYNRSIKKTLDKAQQGLLTERGMPPCILLIASRPALRERDIGTASMGEAGKIEPVLEARKLDRTVCLRAFSIIVSIAALPQQRRLWDGEAPSYSSAVSNT